MNKFDEMRIATSEAHMTLRAADAVAGDMAHMLVGRLRKVASTSTLVALKMELRNFDAHTKEWKNVK